MADGGSSGGVQVVVAEVIRAAALALASATLTDVPFDTEGYDEAAFWAAGSPTIVTIPATGVYVVAGWADISVIAGFVGRAQLTLAGTVVSDSNFSDNVGANRTVRQVVDFVGRATAGQQLKMRVLGDGPVTNTLNRAELRIARIR